MNKIVGLWKSGAKGKAICVGGIAMVLLLLLLTWGCGGSSDKGKWQYKGKPFHQVLTGRPEDEGEVYVNKGYYIKIMQATKKGNLVECFGDRVIWVETPGKRYEDGQLLGDGYYVRRGLYEYETALGTEKTVARYVQVTDKKMLQEIEKIQQKLEKAIEEAQKAAEEAKEALEAGRKTEEEAKKKAREEAAEQGAYELKIPVKSLCGFKLGAPPSQVKDLLQYDDGKPVVDLVEDLNKHRNERSYRLVKPFRLFTHVSVTFADEGVGKHLAKIELFGEEIDDDTVSEESCEAEVKATAKLIEQKFGINLSGRNYWEEKSGKESISIDFDDCLHLAFEAEAEIERLDEAAKKAKKKSVQQLDANAGADNL